MKYLKIAAIALCVLFASNAFGQTKSKSPYVDNNVLPRPTIDSLQNGKLDSLTRDTKFLSINDVFRIYETFSDKVTVKDGRVFENIMQAILNQAVAEYYDKQKQLPKK